MALKTMAAWLWAVSIIYFPIQWVVAAAWNHPFDWKQNFTSNLGNTACGTFDGAFICSPLHALMNATFVVIGIANLLGALLFAYAYRSHKAAVAGFLCLALGGVGSVIVGLVPENIDLDFHSLGAFLPFLLGNLGLLILGLSSFLQTRWLRLYTLATGFFGVLAYILLETKTYLGLGVGGMERTTDYVQVIWFIVFAIVILCSSQSKLKLNVFLQMP